MIARLARPLRARPFSPPVAFRVAIGALLLVLAYGGRVAAWAQETIVVEPAGRATWDEIVAFDAASPRSIPATPAEVPYMRLVPGGSLTGTNGGTPSRARSAVEAPADAPRATGPTLTTGFAALGDDNTSIPPDTNGAAGPNHLMTMLNTQVRIQNKSGGVISTVALASFWTAGTGLSGTPFDPRVQYDSASGRWIATVDADPNSASSAVWFAISAGSDPTGTWTFFSFVADAGGTTWADFPGLGTNNTWIAITQNMFTIGASPAFQGAKMWVVDKATALAGGPLTTTVFLTGFNHAPVGCVPFSPGCNWWSFAMMPAVTFGPASTLYIADSTGFAAGGTMLLRLSQITGTGPAPVWAPVPDAGGPFPGSGFFLVANNFDPAMIPATQAGTATTIDNGDIRISTNSVFRNGRLWFAHHGGLPVGAVDRTAVFWYQVDPLLLQTTGAPIVQSGVLDGGSGVHHYYPSISANALDDACIGFSRSDATRFVETVTTGRFGTDPAGTMMLPLTVLKAGEDSYEKTGVSSTVVRWGDYSATVVDPDDLSFWTIQEYAALDVGPATSDDRWGTWWGFKQVTGPSTTVGPPTTTTTTTTGGPTTTTSTTTTTLAPLCGSAPEPSAGCRLNAAGKGQLQIKDKTNDNADQIKWKWNKGDATTTADFKDPVAGSATYRLCVYEDVSGTPAKIVELDLPPGGTCGTKPCWKALGPSGSPKGFKYKDKDATPDGITGAKFKEGVAGKAQVQIKAKGVNISMPALPLTGDVTAQLLIDDGISTECFQTTYTAPHTKNDAAQFKAKGP